MSAPSHVHASEIVIVDGRRQERREVLAGMFLSSYGNARTRDAYSLDLRKYFAFADEKGFDVLEARRAMIDLFVRYMEDEVGLAPASCCRRITALSAWYQWLVDEEYIPRTPMSRVRRPKIPRNQPRSWMGRHQLADWLDAAEDEGGYPFALACLLANNALRVGEVVRADIEDMGTERHHTTLAIMGKGSKPDVIALTARTAYALHQAHDGRETGPLILTAAGTRLTRESAARTVKRLAKKAGITKHLTPHSLRRSAITGLLEDGADLRDVQDFARHEDPATTRMYDMRKRSLDRHGAYRVEGYIAAGGDRVR